MPEAVRAAFARAGFQVGDPRRRGSRRRTRACCSASTGDAPRGERPAGGRRRDGVVRRCPVTAPAFGPLASPGPSRRLAPDVAATAARRRRAPARPRRAGRRPTRSSGRRRSSRAASPPSSDTVEESARLPTARVDRRSRTRGSAHVHPDDRDRVVEAWTKAAEGERLDVEYRFADEGRRRDRGSGTSVSSCPRPSCRASDCAG